jgi:hypothetical protein
MPSRTDRLTGLVLAFEVANAAYLAAYDSATIFYHAMVVAHVVAGALLAPLLLWRGLPLLKRARGGAVRLLAALAAVAALVAIATAARLAIVGTATPYRALLTAHIATSCTALAAAALAWLLTGPALVGARRAAILLIVAGLFPLAVRGYDRLFPAHVSRIENPALPPLSADQEGGGPAGAFFPSSVTTVGNAWCRTISSSSRRRAATPAVIPTSPGSGPRRCTTSRRSTTSGTASRSSTCRTSSAPSRRSGAAAATISRCS